MDWLRAGGQPAAPPAPALTLSPARLPAGARFPHPADCSQVQQNSNAASGLYTIYLHGDAGRALQVYCDLDTDGGGWTVSGRSPRALGRAGSRPRGGGGGPWPAAVSRELPPTPEPWGRAAVGGLTAPVGARGLRRPPVLCGVRLAPTLLSPEHSLCATLTQKL